MNPVTRRWFHGLISGFVGGAAGAIQSGLALVIIDPEHFNLSEGLLRTLLTVLVMGILVGIQTSMAYLKQAPTPWTNGDPDRRNRP